MLYWHLRGLCRNIKWIRWVKLKPKCLKKTEQIKNKQWTKYFCCSQNTEWIGVHIFRVKRILFFVVFNNKHKIQHFKHTLEILVYFIFKFEIKIENELHLAVIPVFTCPYLLSDFIPKITSRVRHLVKVSPTTLALIQSFISLPHFLNPCVLKNHNHSCTLAQTHKHTHAGLHTHAHIT